MQTDRIVWDLFECAVKSHQRKPAMINCRNFHKDRLCEDMMIHEALCMENEYITCMNAIWTKKM